MTWAESVWWKYDATMSSLSRARSGQDEVGVGGGVREEQVADDRQQILARESRPQRLLLWARRDGVDVPADERAAAPGSARTSARSIWLIEAGASARASWAPASQSESTPRESLPLRYRNPRAGAADVARQCGQHPDGAHDVAAARLALQPLAHPEQRGAAPVGARGVLDQARWHAGLRLGPGRRQPRAGARARRSRARAPPRRPSTRPSLRITCANAKASAASLPGRSWRYVSAAAAVGVRIGSITITWPRASLSQWSCACGALAEGFAPHTRMHSADRRRLGVEAFQARAVDIRQRHVPGVVADGVGLDFRRAEAVEEALGEGAVDQRAGARCSARLGCSPRRAPARSTPGARAMAEIASATRPARSAASPFGPTRRSGVVRRSSGSMNAPL